MDIVRFTGPGANVGVMSHTQPMTVPISGGADLSQATGVTINDLRQSIVLQQFFERMARCGSRYTECTYKVYSVAHLQMPDYNVQSI
jgi:hypothetical protein